jgi:hypothetical protein
MIFNDPLSCFFSHLALDFSFDDAAKNADQLIHMRIE